jgi:hypothetical protein
MATAKKRTSLIEGISRGQQSSPGINIIDADFSTNEQMSSK